MRETTGVTRKDGTMAFRRSYVDDGTEARVVDDDPVVVDEERERVTPAIPWSPAQIVGLIIGIGMTVLGVVALAKTGFDTGDIENPKEVVWRMSHSPLLALCELGFGVLLIVASVVPGGLRTLMALLGAIALTFGILILVDAARDDLVRWFGVGDRNGWFFVIIGSVVLLASMLSPVFFGGYSRRRVRHALR
jgi:hypothetical protein